MSAGALPAGLGQAFRVAVAELGLCTASWLFVEEVAAAGGPGLVEHLRDAFGRDWPVLDAVAAAHLLGARRPTPDPREVLEVLGQAEQLVCVGIEADLLDALVRATRVPIALVRQSVFGLDWDRFAANYEGRLELEELDTFQRRAGPRSVLLTFVYGTDASRTHVLPAWLRASGEDVRAQFRSLVAWEALGQPFFVYPQWLVSVPTTSFSHVVR